VGSWGDSLRAITGLDERQVGTWLVEGGRTAGAVLAVGADKVGAGAKVAGQTAQKGIRAYFNWVIFVWSTIFRWIGSLFSFLWAVITFIPRKLMGSKQTSIAQVPSTTATSKPETRAPSRSEEERGQFE
jgi:hypothetical protein